MLTSCTTAVLAATLASAASAGYMDPDGYALRSGQAITLNDRSSVTGSVGAVRSITARSGSSVSGVTSANDASFFVTAPTMPSAGSSRLTVTWDANQSVTPGSYGSFTARDRSTVSFSAGDYVFSSFKLGFDTRLAADTSAGDVNIYVLGQTTVSDRADVTRTGENDLFFLNDGNVTLGYETNVFASVYSFNGKVTIRDRADLVGSAYSSNNLTLGYDATVTYSGSTFGRAVPAPGVATLAALAGACVFCRGRSAV